MFKDCTSTTDESTRRRGDAEKIENLLAAQVIDAAIEVHRTLGGPGLLESLYEEALYQELRLRDISVQAQVQIPVIYKGYTLRNPMRVNLLVDGKVISEGHRARTGCSQSTSFDVFAFNETQVGIAS